MRCAPASGLSLLLALAVIPLHAAEPAPLSLAVGDPRLTINGLGWLDRTQPRFVRLPADFAEKVRPPVWQLAQVPTGVRLRFATDSTTLSLTAEGSGTAPGPHLTAFGAGGVDLYLDGTYVGSASASKEGRLEKTWTLGTERRMRQVTVYLPFGRPLLVRRVDLDASATVAPPAAFRHAKPVVYYGSSITQGIAASNPGLTFPAQVGRTLNLDFINLGFSGNGMGEPALAEAVAALDALCFVVDYWANPTPEVYQATLPNFIRTLRARHPTAPILVTGPFFNPSEDQPGQAGIGQKEKRVIAAAFVAAQRQAGDANIHFVDGLQMIDRAQADSLVDGRHPNSLGFARIAWVLAPKIAEVTGLR